MWLKLDDKVRAIAPTAVVVQLRFDDKKLNYYRVEEYGVNLSGALYLTRWGAWRAALHYLKTYAVIRAVRKHVPSAYVIQIHLGKQYGGSVFCIKSTLIDYLSLDCKTAKEAWDDALTSLPMCLWHSRYRRISFREFRLMLGSMGLPLDCKQIPRPANIPRNHLYIEASSSDWEMVKRLTTRGFMRLGVSDAGKQFYTVTEYGWKSLRLRSGEIA